MASDPGQATEVLSGAVAELVAERSFAFQVNAVAGSDQLYRLAGTVDGSSWLGTLNSRTVAGPVVINVRSIDDAMWIQLFTSGTPPTDCWLRLGPGEVPYGLLGVKAGEPVYLGLVNDLATSGFSGPSGKVMEGSLPLPVAAELLTQQILDELDLGDATDRDRVPVLVEVDEQLRRVILEWSDFQEAVEGAGGSVPADVARGLADLRVQVEYLPPYPQFPGVEAPDPDLVITEGDPSAGC